MNTFLKKYLGIYKVQQTILAVSNVRLGYEKF